MRAGGGARRPSWDGRRHPAAGRLRQHAVRRTTMSIFHRILFAGDLSERSRGAFGAAGSLAGESGAHLHVLYVVEPTLLAEPPGPARGARLPAILPPDTAAHRKELEGELRAFYHAEPPIAADYV